MFFLLNFGDSNKKRGRTWGLLIRLGTEAGSAGTLISGKTKWVERLTDAVYAQSASCQQETDSRKLLQLDVFRLGLLQDRNVRVGIFPEREEIPIRCVCFCDFTLYGPGTTNLKMSQCTDGFVYYDSAMV